MRWLVLVLLAGCSVAPLDDGLRDDGHWYDHGRHAAACAASDARGWDGLLLEPRP